MRLRLHWAAPSLMLLALTAAPASATHVDDAGIQWACGFGTRHPDNCGIDPVGGGEQVRSEGEPRFSTADWLEDSDRVMGLAMDGDVRAYPIKMFNTHEIVNDVVAGIPVAVTFCPLCGSGVTYERLVETGNGTQELTFAPSGFLWKHDMVMWDPETSTLWTQIQGVPIATYDEEGREPLPHHPDWHLEPVASSLTTWGAWKAEHPDTTLLQPVFGPGSYREFAYGDYEQESNCRFGISNHRDCDVEGLHPKEQVVATEHAGGGLAFPILGVQQNGGAAYHETADGGGYVATADFGGASAIYLAGDRTFTQDDSGLWFDDDGVAWDLPSARSVDGSLGLERVDSLVLFWFAWNEHVPATELWLPPIDDGLLDPDGGSEGVPAPGVATVLIAVGAVAWAARGTRR